MKYCIVVISLFLSSSAVLSEELSRSHNSELTQALAYGSEIANNFDLPNSGHLVRVFAVPVMIGECSGSLESCPDWRLLVTVSTGDLYDEPMLYELPTAKGWRFVSWDTSATDKAVFQVQTQIPDANLDMNARNAWDPVTYQVSIWLFDVVVNEPKASARILSDKG